MVFFNKKKKQKNKKAGSDTVFYFGKISVNKLNK
jgi:hypothetical protein